MVTEMESTAEENFSYKWHIENFNYCCQKTGEFLQSPPFSIPSFEQSTWRLRIYPRGEDDGEYVGCFLYRGARGGPETVNVDFELSLSVAESQIAAPVSFLKMYFFKTLQREGLKCFARRWEVFAPKAAQKDNFTLALTCKILNLEGCEFGEIEQFGRTKINVERISGMEVLSGEDLNPECNRDVDAQPLLEDEPLIGINVSHFDESLVIKINPKTCGKIKYAICKLTVMNLWPTESPIEHICSWIGEIEEDVGMYHVPVPENDLAEAGSETANQVSFFLLYEFSFTTGEEVAMNYYGAHLFPRETNLQDCLYANPISEMPLTALEALESKCESCCLDLYIRLKSEKSIHFLTHRAVLCARSSYFKSVITRRMKDFVVPIDVKAANFHKFIQFMYTDTVKDLTLPLATDLYLVANHCKVDLLKSICTSFLADNLDIYNAANILLMAHTSEDVFLKKVAKKYILKYDVDVFATKSWLKFARSNDTLARETMLLKFSQESI